MSLRISDLKSHKKLLIALFLVLIPLTFFAFYPQPKEKNTSRAKPPIYLGTENTAFLRALNDYRHAPPDKKQASLLYLKNIAGIRKQVMLALMEKKPEEVERTMLSEDRNTLPPEIQDDVERVTTLKGEMQLIHAHYANESVYNNTGFTNYLLKTGNQYRTVTYANKDTFKPAFAKPVNVNAHGIVLQNRVVIPNKNALKPSTNASNVLGTRNSVTKKLAIVRFNWSNYNKQPDSISDAKMQEVVFQGNESAKAFFNEVSYGQLKLEGKVFDWVTIPDEVKLGPNGTPEDTCDGNMGNMNRQIDAAKALATQQQGLTDDYDYYYFFTPGTHCAGAAGFSGGKHLWGNETYMNLHIFAHEMGHAFGMFGPTQKQAGHSSGWRCGTNAKDFNEKVPNSTEPEPPLGPDDCQESQSEPYTALGGGDAPHYNTYQKWVMGWLNDKDIQDLVRAGEYKITPQEKDSDSFKVLKIPLQDGSPKAYYVEYRQQIGFDQEKWFAKKEKFDDGKERNLFKGVTIYLTNPSNTDPNGVDTYIVDTTPETRTVIDGALEPGKKFEDKKHKITIETVSVNGKEAVIKIDMQPIFNCISDKNKCNPTPTSPPPNGDGNSGGKKDCDTSKYAADIQKNPLKKNFGDPNCDFTKDDLYKLLKQTDAATADRWFNSIVPCESGYNPNAYHGFDGLSPDQAGSWGLYQMGRGENGSQDHGDVEWRLQTTNAVGYNKKTGGAFAYWGCAKK